LTNTTDSGIHWRVGRRALYAFFPPIIDCSLPAPSALIQAAQVQNKELIVLDLSKSSTANTPVLEWIEQVTALAGASGIKLRVVATDGSRIYRLLDILRFSRFVLVLGSVREALSFGRRGNRLPSSRR
jgi:hypothetical protein